MEEEKSKKKKTSFWGPVIVALCVDLIQFGINLLSPIPIIGIPLAVGLGFVVSTLAWALFYLYFKMKGVDFSIPKKGIGFVGGAILEFIPFLNALPGWTIGVALAAGKEKMSGVAVIE
jgi:hypothetical protein